MPHRTQSFLAEALEQALPAMKPATTLPTLATEIIEVMSTLSQPRVCSSSTAAMFIALPTVEVMK